MINICNGAHQGEHSIEQCSCRQEKQKDSKEESAE